MKDAREHRQSLLGEDVRGVAAATSAVVLRSQFVTSKLSPRIKTLVFAAMEFGQVLVEHHLPFADDVDPLLNRRSGGSPEAFIRFLLVTLVLSVHSRNYLWLVVDRRLSYGARRPPVDDAVKVMNLETTDGVGLLAYAGLGATSSGTQPSDWMSAVLRGRGGLTFEQALGVLSTAATKQLPKHLAQLPYGAHFIIIPAFVRGVGSRLYSIDNVVDPKGQRHWYRYTSHQRTVEPGSPSVRLAVGGTGGLYLAKNRSWQRSLLSLVNAHDRGKVSDHVVADRLARLNYEAHQVVRDASVGPRCIVVWRRRPDAQPGAPGGGHQFYTGVDRDLDSASIPAIANGMDVHAIIGVVMKDFQARTASHGFSFAAASDFDKDEMTRLLAELPSEPDERLR